MSSSENTPGVAAKGFAELALPAAQLSNLNALGYESMTPIQAASLPLLLDGRDVLARAKTGSGKTAAFGIALINRLTQGAGQVQALVLCPTRELCDQVAGELRRLARARPNTKLLVIVGGKAFGPQKQSLERGADIVVGTPGRVLDHLQKNTLDLTALHSLILDEADRMLDMGFSDAMTAIVKRLPAGRQTLLFSATYPSEIATMSAQVQRDPVTVAAEAEHQSGQIAQTFYRTTADDRSADLVTLYQHYQPESSVVFCQTRKDCAAVLALLDEHRIEALALHGDLEQRERDAVLAQFANRSCPVLVATDVAARGLDIANLGVVFNYELPREADVYVHRIGRTGRAGERGTAVSLVAATEERRFAAIEEALGAALVNAYLQSMSALRPDRGYMLRGTMATLELAAGRKNKLRRGDVLGALTGDGKIPGASIGKIDVLDTRAFIAIERSRAKEALAFFGEGKVKGRRVRARRLR